MEPMRSDPKDVNVVAAGEGLPKRSVAASVRRATLFLLAIALVYFFIWVPWRTSPSNFPLFLGFGMIQIAAIYTQVLRDGVMAWDAPPLFLNSFMFLLVSGLALVGFVIGLLIGFKSKPWWEGLLLPIPPFVFATYLFRRPNPAPPLSVGLGTLLLSLILKAI
jgi:hypothetical protein